ncbi:hypothetical protein HW532_12865 [Kaustia mangrovi]|uniref:Uncharacterized protein n=1 Tax=Kaustia mangrovi TaxID=2593653 RepID=A0A7S8C503_9HYPH|nr:hypothetical protein [Kaustia mangrovi]QPC43509.1 hypothetical protein HW532_12865 [Kaustia mangrovi]
MANIEWRAGDRVHVLNCTMGGTFVVEGEATIVRPVDGVDCQYLVDFNDGYGPVERFVDPDAQGDPAGFVARLNGSTA